MARNTYPALTPTILAGLQYLYHFRSLTIAQYARLVGLSHNHAGQQLRVLELHQLVSHYGNVGLRGHGKTPKVYYLTRKGYGVLVEEADFPPAGWKPAYAPHRWSPKMYHRLAVVDFLVAVHAAVRSHPTIILARDYLETRREFRDGRQQRETYDLITPPDTPENRIIPDAAFILANAQTGRRALFLVEVDRGTEPIAPATLASRTASYSHKLAQYARYLQQGSYREKYGDFPHFVLLTATTTDRRLEHLRAQTPAPCARVFLFTTLERALTDPLAPIWQSGDPSDTRRHPIVR